LRERPLDEPAGSRAARAARQPVLEVQRDGEDALLLDLQTGVRCDRVQAVERHAEAMRGVAQALDLLRPRRRAPILVE